MPEGHSIHRLARQLDDVFSGEVLEITSPQGRFSEGAAAISGGRLARSYAHGKHLFVEFENEQTLNIHLGIYGAFTFGGDEEFSGASSIGAPRKIGEKEDHEGLSLKEYLGPPAPKPTVRCRMVSKHGWADLIGPTVCRVLIPEQVQKVRSQLGPDPLNPDANPEQFFVAAAGTSRPIGVVLMDQKCISGVGNIFRAESLYRCGIDPLRAANTLTRSELEALWEDNRHLLEIGVRVGRIITTNQQDRPGIDENHAWPEHANYVYQHQGQDCTRCGGTISIKELAARKLYWCPGCQK